MSPIHRILAYVVLISSISVMLFTGWISNLKAEIVELRNENINLTYQLNQQQFKKNVELKNIQRRYDELKKKSDSLFKKRILTTDDIKSLEKIVEAEASNQGIQGKAMVSSVVLNRWLNDNKSIHYILTRPRQFQSVANGMFDKAIPTDETKAAVNMAIYKDYSHGSLYFMNPKISSRNSVRWFRESLTYITKYKQHQFYK